MAKFKGKNSLKSTITLAVNRSKYDVEAFPENKSLGPKGVVDFNFAERTMYGRLDENLNVVVPKRNFLKTISNNGINSVTLMNFVADAFRDFQKAFQRNSNVGKIRRNDPFLSSPQAYNSYTDPKVAYDNYFAKMMKAFQNIFLRKDKITSPKNYFDEFLRYIEKITPTFPITYTAWHRSRYSSILSSGLAIDLAGLAIDNDELKEEFIGRENFEFYKTACISYGFSIVKNSPWIIVADLDSPASTLYHKNYGMSSINQIFSEQFDLTSKFDIEYLKNNLYNSYNQFVNRFPYKKEFEYCNKSLITNNVYRYNINIDKFNSIYNNKYIIMYYNNIRNFEEGKVFSESDKNKIGKNAKNLEKTFDISRAIGYINEQYRSVYKSKPGGLNSVLKRTQNKNLED